MNDIGGAKGVAQEIKEIRVERIMEMIPHRYPMLLVDRVIDVVPNQSATGIKNVSVNEPFFVGHFPRRPVMPGVMIVEAIITTVTTTSR